MHLAFASVPAHGHINPTLPLVRELVSRGHRVTYGTHEKFRDRVEAVGASLLPMPGDMPAPPRDFNLEEMERMVEIAIDNSRRGYEALSEGFVQDPPAALCTDMMTLAAKMTAEKLRLPEVALVSTHASHEHFSMHAELMESDSEHRPPYSKELFEKMRELTQQLAEEIGVTVPDPMGATPSPLNIVFLPKRFQLEADTFDERFHFVGPSLGDRFSAGDWQPPAGEGPLAFISLGTVVNNHPEFFRTCVEAFGDGHWRIAMAIGENIDVAELGPIPDNIEVREYFPQPQVLRHADLFVSHAGMNSTLESLYCGVPMVTAPQQPEQAANAGRVEELGFGRPLDTAELTADSLRALVDEVHADERIRENTAKMSAELQACGGPKAAADAIEAHLG